MIFKTIKSFHYAFLGICWVFKSENNARVHLLATVTAVTAGLYTHISGSEWLWILISITLVWVLEILNTAIEQLVDIVSPEYNKEAGKIKDLCAGAVLVAAVFSVVCACIIFVPYLKKN
jgi:diacylglycerol kinase